MSKYLEGRILSYFLFLSSLSPCLGEPYRGFAGSLIPSVFSHLSVLSLSQANLTEASLVGSSLVAARLQGSCLVRANLRKAHLASADLRKAP